MNTAKYLAKIIADAREIGEWKGVEKPIPPFHLPAQVTLPTLAKVEGVKE